MLWTSLAAVALGSAVGGMLRYAIGLVLPPRGVGGFPIATLLINVVGSFLLGVLSRYAVDGANLSAVVRLALTVGFCGGFTTFSAFSHETVRLVEAGQGARAALYVVLSVGLSVLAAAAGLALGRRGGA